MQDETMRTLPASRDESLFHYLEAIRPYCRSIFFSMGILILLTLCVARIFVSHRYEAEAVFVPPALRDTSIPIPALVDTLNLDRPNNTLSSILGSSKSPVLLVVQSHAVRRSVIRRLALMQVYDLEDMEKAEKKLQARTTIKVDISGAIQLKVQSEDPGRAKALVEAYLQEIRSRATELVRKDTERILDYMGERSEATQKKLDEALNAWQVNQERFTMLDVEGSAKALQAVITQLTTVRFQSLAELRTLLAGLGDEAPEVIAKRTYLRELDRQINLLRGRPRVSRGNENTVGNPPTTSDESEFGITSIRSMPKLAVLEQRLQLDIDSQIKITAMQKAQLEWARLSLIKHQQEMRILDPPMIPLHPTNRKLYLALAGIMISIVASIVQALVRLSWRRFYLTPSASSRN